jgi:molybdate transport system substrate-binding protein
MGYRFCGKRYTGIMRLIALALLAWAWSVNLATAQEVRVAVSANLRPVFEQLQEAFAPTGIRVVASYGSSGAFVQQITNGAPFDIFMSADLDFPKALEKRGLLEAGSLKPYAIGGLGLWFPRASQATLRTLLEPRIKRLVVANPETSPYGKATLQALKRSNLYEAVRTKLVFAQNIAQATQLTLASGDAGFVAASARSPQGSWILVPPNLFDPILQGYAIVKGRSRPEVRRFYAFLGQAEARKIYQAWGYRLP